jgi:hypothetical protein
LIIVGNDVIDLQFQSQDEKERLRRRVEKVKKIKRN